MIYECNIALKNNLRKVPFTNGWDFIRENVHGLEFARVRNNIRDKVLNNIEGVSLVIRGWDEHDKNV